MTPLSGVPTPEAEGQDDSRAGVSTAGTLMPPAEAEMRALTGPNPRRLNIYFGAQVVSMYIARGLVYSDQPSFQPWVEVDLPLAGEARSRGGWQTLHAFFGNWNSLQEGGPGLGQARTGEFVFQDNWYESDLYAGLRARWAEHFTTSLRFNLYHSPSGSFSSIRELDWRISYNDAPFWENRFGLQFGLYPSLRVAKEIADSGGPQQWYLQPSLAPVLSLTDPVALNIGFPVAAGFGGNGQYVASDGEDRRFGFVQAGLTVEVPITVASSLPGDWKLSGGATVVFLADRDLSFRGDQLETVFHLGLSAGF
ncbi:MAG: hypothetical protein ACFE0O_08230 [Opitutales bacterium]